MNFKIVFLLPILLLAGCIQVRTQQPEAAEPVKTTAASGIRGRLPLLVIDKIARQEIGWEDLCRYPAPEQMWREDRFRLIRPNGELHPSDFKLKRSSGKSGRSRRVSFLFLPLRVAFDGARVWDTRVDFVFGDDDEIEDIRMVSELNRLSSPEIFRLSASSADSVTGAVLKKLFSMHLPKSVRARERFRFCFPVNGADEKYRNHLHPRARIPELDPTEEYPDFPLPFEKGRYRSLEHGAFYYYAGIVLPVTEKEVWVFDTAVRYDGGETRGAFFKLKKGLILWEVVSEGSYDAPSRAVREKETL
ncbi:MAG: hypothetical protein IJS14_13055 [Lentisphaeria bacterium]|nr:hypothetical protein [Lentisphaeria bacterium]